VLATRPPSDSAARVAAAAADPDAAPPVSVPIELAGDTFADPERSWNFAELEALARAHPDDEVRLVPGRHESPDWRLSRAAQATGKRSLS